MPLLAARVALAIGSGQRSNKECQVHEVTRRLELRGRERASRPAWPPREPDHCVVALNPLYCLQVSYFEGAMPCHQFVLQSSLPPRPRSP